MDKMLIDDVASERLDQLREQVERANLRLAWRMRFWNFLHGRLTLAQHSQLQAECLRVFGPRWREEISPSIIFKD